MRLLKGIGYATVLALAPSVVSAEVIIDGASIILSEPSLLGLLGVGAVISVLFLRNRRK